MNAPIVVKLGGRALDEAESRGDLWDALAGLAASLPGGMVLVHGGGAAVDDHLARLGLASERASGLRVTPESQIGEVVAVLRGSVNTRLVGSLTSRGVRAVGLGLGDGDACSCVKHEPEGVDLGRVGRVAVGEPAGSPANDPPSGGLWRELLAGGFTPVICSIGLDSAGRALNVNADDAALGVARVLGASALVLLTDVPGILDASGGLLDQTDSAGIESLIRDGTISGGMIPKARAAGASADAGGVPTVIASWSRPALLSGLASGEPVGTRVVPAARAGA